MAVSLALKSDVYESSASDPRLCAHAESIITLNVEPSKEHPRNSEGSFATLASGRVIFIYSQFYGGNGDESPARLVASIPTIKAAPGALPSPSWKTPAATT
jgi:hypothetical protein